MNNIYKVAWSGVAAVLMAPLLLYTHAQTQRSPRIDHTETLFAGVTYERRASNTPWPQVIHIVTVDLAAPGIEVVTSPGSPAADGMEVTAQTTSQFLTQADAQVAVNANFFNPFEEKTPWNFLPRVGDRANVLGIGMTAGEVYSPPQSSWPALCFGAQNQVQMIVAGTCPTGTQQAIAGKQQLVVQGKAVPINQADRAYARVMAAVSEGGNQLTLIVVDGKQPLYSEGATLAQLTDIALDLGAEAALNLDGGGSTTLVMDTFQGPQKLNAPIHTKIPMRERPVANHLGIRAGTTPSEP